MTLTLPAAAPEATWLLLHYLAAEAGVTLDREGRTAIVTGTAEAIAVFRASIKQPVGDA